MRVRDHQEWGGVRVDNGWGETGYGWGKGERRQGIW